MSAEARVARRVFVLMKHPPYPYNREIHLEAGEIHGVYLDRNEPDRIASEKNARQSMYFWKVHAKRVKATGSAS